MNSLPEIFHGDFISSAAASVLVEIFPVGISNWALFPYSLSPLLLDFPQLSVVVRRINWNISPEGKRIAPPPPYPPFPLNSLRRPLLFPFSLSLSSNHLGHLSLQGKKRRGGEGEALDRERRREREKCKKGTVAFPLNSSEEII